MAGAEASTDCVLGWKCGIVMLMNQWVVVKWQWPCVEWWDRDRDVVTVWLHDEQLAECGLDVSTRYNCECNCFLVAFY